MSERSEKKAYFVIGSWTTGLVVIVLGLLAALIQLPYYVQIIGTGLGFCVLSYLASYLPN